MIVGGGGDWITDAGKANGKRKYWVCDQGRKFMVTVDDDRDNITEVWADVLAREVDPYWVVTDELPWWKTPQVITDPPSGNTP